MPSDTGPSRSPAPSVAQLSRALADTTGELAAEHARASRLHEAYRNAMRRHGLPAETAEAITTYAAEWLAAHVPLTHRSPLIVAAPTDPRDG